MARRNKEQIMKVLNEIPINLRAVGVTMALAALVIALVAVALAASPTMAQTSPYPDPKPCGPGQQNPPEDPDATVSRGHYAIFDGYWDFRGKALSPNLCPPSVVHTTHTETDPLTFVKTQVEVSTRTASNIDIRETVIHIDSAFEHPLTAEDVETYDFFKVGDSDGDGVDDAVGTTVWWLMADDDEGATTTSDTTEPEAEFHMGFSAALFDSKYWHLKDGTDKGAKPLQYEFEVIREHGIPNNEFGHLFAFDDTPATIKTADWDSTEVDANALALYPGEYYHYQWAFTKPGTYEVWVQLKGHVRQKNPHQPGDAEYDAKWAPISKKTVETSEVMKYVFQVGTLTLNHEPIFEVMRSVEENSATGTPVGDSIKVYQGDDDPIAFTPLSGTGHSLFSVEADADGNAQIKVAGDLDYEVRREYRLTLGVSDNKDHENNAEASAVAKVDNRISINIIVTGHVERSVAENSPGGTQVGAPVVVPGTNATTTYALVGNGSDLFEVNRDSDNNAQIEVAAGSDLDYETTASYDLTLQVRGVVNEDIEVRVDLTDVVERSVAENSAAGTPVGDPIVVAGASTSTMYALVGSGHDLFSVERDSDNNAQIEVAAGASLDHETTASYDLTLTVSGGDDIPVRINVTDVVERSVPENSLVRTLVGDPIVVAGADTSTTYRFTAGNDSNLFTVGPDSDNNAQIRVNGDLDYETTAYYDLTLQPSGGLDSIPVRINVTDEAEFAVSLSVDDDSPTVGDTITFTARVVHMPASNTLLYGWEAQDPDGSNYATDDINGPTYAVISTFTATSDRAGAREYRVDVAASPRGLIVESGWVTVTWQAAQ